MTFIGQLSFCYVQIILMWKIQGAEILKHTIAIVKFCDIEGLMQVCETHRRICSSVPL